MNRAGFSWAWTENSHIHHRRVCRMVIKHPGEFKTKSKCNFKTIRIWEEGDGIERISRLEHGVWGPGSNLFPRFRFWLISYLAETFGNSEKHWLQELLKGTSKPKIQTGQLWNIYKGYGPTIVLQSISNKGVGTYFLGADFVLSWAIFFGTHFVGVLYISGILCPHKRPT